LKWGYFQELVPFIFSVPKEEKNREKLENRKQKENKSKKKGKKKNKSAYSTHFL